MAKKKEPTFSVFLDSDQYLVLLNEEVIEGSFWACIRAELVKDFIKVEEIYRKNQLLEKETTR